MAIISGKGTRRAILWVYIAVLIIIAGTEWTTVLLSRPSKGAYRLDYSPLDTPTERYSDLTNYYLRVGTYGRQDVLIRPDLGLPYPYPLPSFFIVLLYLSVFADPTRAFVWTVVVSFVGAAVLLSVHLGRRYHSSIEIVAVWCTLLFGFPALFLLDRGNIEIFVWLASTLGLVVFAKQRNLSAAVLFGVAASIKIYPALLLLLLLPRRQYRCFGVGVLCTLLISVASVAAFGPDLNATLAGLAWSAKFLKETQIAIVDSHILRWDHSLFSVYKQAKFQFLHLHRNRPEIFVVFFRQIPIYTAVAAGGFILTYLLRLRRLPLLNQYLCLTIASILLPYVSYEYTLVNLYGPFAVLLLWMMEPQAGEVLVRLRAAPYLIAVSFAVLFAPLYVLAFQNFNGQIKALLLLLLFVLFAMRPLPSRVFGDATAAPVLS